MKEKLNVIHRSIASISLLGVIMVLIDFGFAHSIFLSSLYKAFYYLVMICGVAATVLRYYAKTKSFNIKVLLFDVLAILFILFLIYFQIVKPKTWPPLFYNSKWLIIGVLFTFIREFSELRFQYKRTAFNPAQLFIISFMIIIFIGTLLLMLPKATHHGIGMLDALFISTSAVCVNGLAVVDTGAYFTDFGKVMLMILIQIGGLGILTFASYFSYFFKGGASYEDRLALSDLSNAQKLGEVISTLKYIIFITFSVELFSSILIYFSLSSEFFGSFREHLFFSVFHSVSAFCNAGFSTLPDNLYDYEYLKFNYGFQMILLLTFVLGGLGFPIVANVVKYLKHKFLSLILLSHRKRRKPWLLNLNSRITLVSTFTIMGVSFILFYLIEYNHSLASYKGLGKIVAALVGASIPRTAGFSYMELSSFTFATIMLYCLLMWIGASPSSTGGGIKTSTFTIALLNIISLAKGQSKIEIFYREIADISVRRAFATIALSLLVIGIAVLLLTLSEGEGDLIKIIFECFSAYSTAGMSLGITSTLSNIGKFIIIVVMFVGRVSMLTILIAFLNKAKQKSYRYPTEEILIN